ncbi:SpoIID/LytB domain-containing protein [bacterium]|nr:SpoIID/LytB domain-containing protein [bacterium]
MVKYLNISSGNIANIILTILIIPVNIYCEEWVKIGVLGLFHPREVIVTSQTEIPLDVRLDNNEILFMGNNDLHVKYINGKIKIEIGGIGKDYMVSKYTASLNISAPSGFWDVAEFTITIPGKMTRKYSGKLDILRGDDELVLINQVPLERAVEIITFSEMKGKKNRQLLSAFSIVVRSFLKSGIEQHPNDPYDFCDNTHCQLYFGEMEAVYPSLLLEETRGMVLTYEDEIIPPFYCHSCGGHTASSRVVWGMDYPFIIPVNCPYCQESNENQWEAFLPLRQVETLAGSYIQGVAIEEDPASGVVKNVVFTNDGDVTTLRGDQLRIRIGSHLGWDKVLSNRYSIELVGDSLKFKGKGKGHCLGMCLYGSSALSEMGRNYAEILNYYFPNAIIKNTQN